MAACSEQQPTSVWGASGAGAAGSFASILAQNVTTAPEQAQVYIPVQQQDSRADAQIKLQEDYRKWQNMMEQVEQTSDSRLAVKPRLKRRKDRDSFEDMEAEPIVLDAETLKKYFHVPLNVAAQKIGVCTTALKQACRKIGIKSWPHRMLKNMAVTMGASPALLGLEPPVPSSSDTSSGLEGQDTASSMEDVVGGFEMGGDTLEGWADLFSQPADQSYHVVLADCNTEPASISNMEESAPAARELKIEHATAVSSTEAEQTGSRYGHPYVNPKDFSSSKEGPHCKLSSAALSSSAPTALDSASATAPFNEWLLAVQGGHASPPPGFISLAQSPASVPSSPRDAPILSAEDEPGAPSDSARVHRVGDAAEQSARAWAREEEEKWEVRQWRWSECERLRKQVREVVGAHTDILQRLLSMQDGLSRALEERADLEQSIAVLEEQARRRHQQRAIPQRA